MPEDKNTRDHNEAVRQKRIDEERASIERHGRKMDQAVSGGDQRGSSSGNRNQQDKIRSEGCFGMTALVVATPIAVAALRLLG